MGTMVAMAMPAHTMAEDTMVTMARGLLKPSPQLLLSPLLKLILGTVPMAMAMALDTMAMLPGHTMVDTTEDTGVDTGARRRGLPSQQPQLNPTPRLMLNPGTVPMAMVWAIIMVDMVDTVDTMDMAGHTMVAMPGERRKGPLRPSLPL